MSNDMQEIIAEFISECDEMLERISLDLGKIEKGDHDNDTLNSIYRDVHTIKGSAQLFGLTTIGLLGHAVEASLDPLRKGMAVISSMQVDIIYQSLDIINSQLQQLKDTGEAKEIPEVLEQIVPVVISMTADSLGGVPSGLRDDHGIGLPYKGGLPSGVQELKSEKGAKVEAPSPKMEAPSPKVEAPSPKVEAPSPKVEDPAPKAVAPVPSQSSSPPQPNVAEQAPEAPSSGDKEKPAGADGGESIRVQVGVLDNLMNLTGELVLIRNQVLQFASSAENREFVNLSQRINIVTSELQNEVMKTRMQPIGNILMKFHRVVRDLAKQLGKNIHLDLVGTETELDKTLIEAVKDPITHIVRNSVDHGIEPAEARVSSGKVEAGQVTIKSYHEGGQVVIEITDDGKGIDAEKLGAKAVEKGVITENELEGMSERDIQMLIFHPGFSTAEKVTNVSGRGVGMDVVKNNIERIGGLVDLHSEVGVGSTFKLKIPLTLAIVPALIVRSDNQRFAIPQIKIVELLCVDTEIEGGDTVENLQGRPVYRLRGELLPLIDLKQSLSGDNTSVFDHTVFNIVVLREEMHLFGLIVDEIHDSSDIVVKPLAGFLKMIDEYAGATVLGDGDIALTLDVSGISTVAGMKRESDKVSRLSKRSESDAKSLSEDTTEYLLLDVSATNQFVIPLEDVNRLEDFKVSEIDFSGETPVVLYRDNLLPLLDLTNMFSDSAVLSKGGLETISVVVVGSGDLHIGFVVTDILDVFSHSKNLDIGAKLPMGVAGNLIRDEEVISVVDARSIVEKRKESFAMSFQSSQVNKIQREQEGHRNIPSKHHILAVEDSAFFRNQINKILTGYGFKVSLAEDGDAGLKMLQEDPDKYSLVVTDIEMPVMDGIELSKAIRSHSDLKEIPIIAVTTRFRKKDIELGKSVGINFYLEKLNADQIFECMVELLNLEKLVA